MLQSRYVTIVLPHWIIEVILLLVLQDLSPVSSLFIAKDPAAVILRFKNINPGFSFWKNIYKREIFSIKQRATGP